jgi:hypothetical protein
LTSLRDYKIYGAVVIEAIETPSATNYKVRKANKDDNRQVKNNSAEETT